MSRRDFLAGAALGLVLGAAGGAAAALVGPQLIGSAPALTATASFDRDQLGVSTPGGAAPQVATLTVVLRNGSTSRLTHVVVSLMPDRSLGLAGPRATTTSSGELLYAQPDLAPGASATFTIGVFATQAGTWSVPVSAQADGATAAKTTLTLRAVP